MTSGLSRDAVASETWDAIVVGTGMGGATLGHHLACAGWRVLFCERGSSPSARGSYPESQIVYGADDLQRAGRYSQSIRDEEKHRDFVPFVGCGTGGSSAIYGMALERFMPADFANGDWPISYADLAPWYARVESLYRVRGETDPILAQFAGLAGAASLPPAPPMSAAGAEFARFLSGRGLHPYRLPLACDFVAGCTTCQGYLCPMDCKNDANKVCLQPSIGRYGAVLLDGCQVVSLKAQGRRITAVQCLRNGSEIELRARVFILAAGALNTPLILSRSGGNRSPGGLASRSGLVGRRLMRHLIDLYLVRPSGNPHTAFDNRGKEIACNDFYGSDPKSKLGTLQSFGRLPPAQVLYSSLRDDLLASPVGGLARILPRNAPSPLRAVLREISEGWIILASITEDLPDKENMVLPGSRDPNGANIRYRPTPESLARVHRFRAHMSVVLKGRSWRRLAQATNNQRIAHACGTCRLGSDPASSVVNSNCRVHEIDNLYVCDASVFPSSGGTNPALTIAAFALRTGSHILEAHS